MKSFAALGFLLLLLYQLIGLPLAVLTFEQTYERATPAATTDGWKLIKQPLSLPYTTTESWEDTDGQDGLIQLGDDFYNVVRQRYVNDTLYTLLKTNQNARARFVDLTEQLQQFSSDQDLDRSPLSRLLKLLNERLMTYLLPVRYVLAQPAITTRVAHSGYDAPRPTSYGIALSTLSPPPEQ